MSRGNVKRAETGILDEHREAEDLIVKLLGSREVIDIEASFLQIIQKGQRFFDARTTAKMPLNVLNIAQD